MIGLQEALSDLDGFCPSVVPELLCFVRDASVGRSGFVIGFGSWEVVTVKVGKEHLLMLETTILTEKAKIRAHARSDIYRISHSVIPTFYHTFYLDVERSRASKAPRTNQSVKYYNPWLVKSDRSNLFCKVKVGIRRSTKSIWNAGAGAPLIPCLREVYVLNVRASQPVMAYFIQIHYWLCVMPWQHLSYLSVMT